MKYFVGHLINGEAAEYYREITADLASRFGIKNLAEKLPPHLTLRAPFESDDIVQFERRVRRLAGQEKPMRFSIDGFGNFGDKTVFLSVKGAGIKEKLEKIAKTLTDFDGGQKPMPTPLFSHISIARFLKPQEYGKIIEYLSRLPVPNFNLDFDNLTIFIRKENRWNIFKTYYFGK